MQQPSPLYRELDQAIRRRTGRPMADLVTDLRLAGKGWRVIATTISDTAENMVSHETVRAWFADQFVIAPRDPDPTDRAPGS